MNIYSILFGWYSISFFINFILQRILIKQFGVSDYYLRSPRGIYFYMFGYLWFLDKKRIKTKLKIKELVRKINYYKDSELYRVDVFGTYYKNYYDNQIKILSRELKLLKLTQ